MQQNVSSMDRLVKGNRQRVCDRMLDRVPPKVGLVDREDCRAVTQQLRTVTEDDVQTVLTVLFDE